MMLDCPELRSEVDVHGATRHGTQARGTWSAGGECFVGREDEGRERTSLSSSYICVCVKCAQYIHGAMLCNLLNFTCKLKLWWKIMCRPIV